MSKKKKIPLHKKSWKALNAKQKAIRRRSLDVLAESRTSKKSVSKIAKENNISVRTVQNNTNALKKKKRRLVPKRFNKISRMITINENGKAVSVEINNSRTASVIGRYHNAVKQFLRTGDSSKLSSFENKRIRDASGKFHSFETDTDEIIRIEEKVEEPEFREIYAS